MLGRRSESVSVVRFLVPNFKREAQTRDLGLAYDAAPPVRPTLSSTPLEGQQSLQHIKDSLWLYKLYVSPHFQL